MYGMEYLKSYAATERNEAENEKKDPLKLFHAEKDGKTPKQKCMPIARIHAHTR